MLNLDCHSGHPLSPSAFMTAIVLKRASWAFNIIKALARLSWVSSTETLGATHKAVVYPILNYGAPNWFTQVSSTHLYKLEVIQNKTLRIATGCSKKAAVCHLRTNAGILRPRESASKTVFTVVLCKRSQTNPNDSHYRHLLLDPRLLRAFHRNWDDWGDRHVSGNQ